MKFSANSANRESESNSDGGHTWFCLGKVRYLQFLHSMQQTTYSQSKLFAACRICRSLIKKIQVSAFTVFSACRKLPIK